LQTTDWVLIATALFLGACALFVPYLAEIVKRKLFAPELEISFELKPPFCHRTIWRSKPASYQQISEPVYYFRFQVVNGGRTQARLCEAVLENLWVYDPSDEAAKYANFSPVNMRWAATPSQFIDINPGRTVFCDIGHISSPDYQRKIEKSSFIDPPDYNGIALRFALDIQQIFYSQPNCLPPGKYVLEVGLYSENARRQRQCFEVSWSGKWLDDLDEMFRQIRVKCVKRPA
jgi:hypothetical protein